MNIKMSQLFFLLGALMLFTDQLSAQWQNIPSPRDRLFAMIEGSNNRLFGGSEDTGIWVSINGGASFQTYSGGFPQASYDIRSFSGSGDTLWAGIYGGGVVRSIDGGTSWTEFNHGFQTQSVVVGVQQFEDTIYAAVDYAIGLQPSGIYKSPAIEAGWVRSGQGFPQNLGLTSFHITPAGIMFAGAAVAGSRGNVQVSQDGGKTWLNRNIAGVQSVLSLESFGNMVFAGTTDGIYVTVNSGEVWEKYGSEFQEFTVDDILIYGDRIYAAVDPVGVAFAALGDTSWNVLTDNLPMAGDYVSMLFIHQENLLASLSGANGLWRLPLSSLSIGEIPPVSRTHMLHQNYPNPFNTVTIIAFDLTAGSSVSLKIFNLLGDEVATLITGWMPAGSHRYRWDAAGFASGIYLCTLTVGNYGSTRKLVLIK
jgi:photosystem II stability/assembly factor-like uncharacterized protein